jgi:hypothetical protein
MEERKGDGSERFLKDTMRVFVDNDIRKVTHEQVIKSRLLKKENRGNLYGNIWISK